MKALGRPRAFDRESALAAAMLVFWRKGFLASSMNDLCEAMGIRSPSLYAAFGSKEKLYEEAVAMYNEAAHARIWNHVSAAPTVREGMKKALLAAAEILAGSADEPNGCLVTLAAGEGCDASVAEIARAARTDSLAALCAALKAAVASGELPRSTRVETLGRFYLGIVQAMAVQGRDGASRATLAAVAEVAMAAWPVSVAAGR